MLQPDLLYMVWIKSYLHVNSNVEISSLNWSTVSPAYKKRVFSNKAVQFLINEKKVKREAG